MLTIQQKSRTEFGSENEVSTEMNQRIWKKSQMISQVKTPQDMKRKGELDEFEHKTVILKWVSRVEEFPFFMGQSEKQIFFFGGAKACTRNESYVAVKMEFPKPMSMISNANGEKGLLQSEIEL